MPARVLRLSTINALPAGALYGGKRWRLDPKRFETEVAADEAKLEMLRLAETERKARQRFDRAVKSFWSD